jgi:hypothetical protein
MSEQPIVEHVNVKIFARNNVDLAPAIPVFHRWIQENACPELLIDVADYRHVPAGPGVLLVGHEANYSLDSAEERLGLLYNRKAALNGTTRHKIWQAIEAALHACRRLEDEPAFEGLLRFDAGDCEIIFNDRLLTPNTEATWAVLQPDLDSVLRSLFGPMPYTLRRAGEPRERLRAAARTATPVEVASILGLGVSE